jgi:hypothetical protein
VAGESLHQLDRCYAAVYVTERALFMRQAVKRAERREGLVPAVPDLNVHIPDAAIFHHPDASDSSGASASKLGVATSRPRVPLLALDLEAEPLKVGNEGSEPVGKFRHAANASDTPRLPLSLKDESPAPPSSLAQGCRHP